MRASHAVVVVPGEAAEAEARVRAARGDLRVMSAGQVIEIYKDVGLPEVFAETFELDDLRGTHAPRAHADGDGEPCHDRGLASVLDRPRPLPRPQRSLSNHNTLRRALRREGIEFQTENDTEVAAGYLAWRLREGASLEAALEGCLDDLDGFYTFAVGTADGFAVLRDPIACKPAVLAETDEWVAMASEYHAIAVLPGADDARDVGAGAWQRLRLGQGSRRMSENARSRGRRSGGDAAPRAQSAAPRHRAHRRGPRVADRQPARRARGRLRARRRARRRDRRARRATTAPA